MTPSYFSHPAKKPKAARMGARPEVKRESEKHRRWIRTLHCVVPWCERRDIECAHARLGLPRGEQAGAGQKPHDVFCFPACRDHHRHQHQYGEESFAREFLPPGVSCAEMALKMYAPLSLDPSIRDKAKELWRKM